MARNKGQCDSNTTLAFMHPSLRYRAGVYGDMRLGRGVFRRGRAKALHPGLRALRAGV